MLLQTMQVSGRTSKSSADSKRHMQALNIYFLQHASLDQPLRFSDGRQVRLTLRTAATERPQEVSLGTTFSWQVILNSRKK